MESSSETYGRPLPPKHEYRPLGQGEYITKDQFGVTLYEAIKVIGGLLGLEQQRAAAIHQNQGYKVQGLLDRRAVLVKEWTRFRAILPHEEVKAIVARYPWVRDL